MSEAPAKRGFVLSPWWGALALAFVVCVVSYFVIVRREEVLASIPPPVPISLTRSSSNDWLDDQLSTLFWQIHSIDCDIRDRVLGEGEAAPASYKDTDY